MTSQPSPLLVSNSQSQSCVRWRGGGKQSRACREAPTLASQIPSLEEETRSQERGNTARERWGGARLLGARGKRAPPFLG